MVVTRISNLWFPSVSKEPTKEEQNPVEQTGIRVKNVGYIRVHSPWLIIQGRNMDFRTSDQRMRSMAYCQEITEYTQASRD